MKLCFCFIIVRHEWTSNQTKRLIALVGEYLEQVKAARNKQHIWSNISEEFETSSITGKKCEDKWKNPKKGYQDYEQKPKALA